MPLAYSFFSCLNLVSPSSGIERLDLKRDLTNEKRCANTISATEMDDAAGVFATSIPLLLAYSTSILSIPTPPRPINFKLGHLSINSFLTFVALLTSKTSIDSELI